MQSKYLLIAIATMAVTASGAQAYVGNKGFSKTGLSPHQVEVFAQARELHSKGEVEKAKELLDGLGLSMMSMRGYMHKRGYHSDRFLELTPEQHDALRAARQANDHETVKAILTEVGIEDVDSHPHVFKKGWQ